MRNKSFLHPPKLSVFLLVCFGLFYPLVQVKTFSQVKEFTVKGVVKDATATLPGVNIQEKGSMNGAITDLDGNYVLRVSNQNAILVFTYIGYEPQEVKVNGKEVVNVTMAENSYNLENIVVIGYGTAKKKDLTGAISSVKAEKLSAEAPRSVTDLLRGNSAGVNITLANNAKGDANIQIRGKNTLTAESTPLIVLDGTIFEGSMADINPSDILSVDILKDASSAAVYGAKSASGVVMINTKRGKSGKPQINFNTSIGVMTPGRMPSVLSPEQFLQFRYDYEVGKNSDAYLAQYPQMFVAPDKLNGVDQLTWYNYDKKTPATSVTQEDLTRTWLTRLELKAPEIDNYLANNITDWQDKVFQNGLQQDYNVSISNNKEDVSYYWSMGYANREGMVTDQKYDIFRTRLNLESKVARFLTVGVNANFSSRNETYFSGKDSDKDRFLYASWGQMVNISPYGSDNMADLDSPYRKYPTGDQTPVNPFFDQSYRDRKDLYNTLNANIYAKVSLPFGIEYQMNFLPYYYWREYYYHESSAHPDWAAKGGEAMREHTKRFSWQVDNIIRWKKAFNNIHNVEVTLLANAEKAQSWRSRMTATGFVPSDILGYHRVQAGTTPPKLESDDWYQTGDALMGRLFYSLMDKYMLTASVRRDGYSAFGQKNPRAIFPAVALGWVFTSEKFAEPIQHWFNYGKLRVSWGENGNRDIGRYDALSDMTSGPHPYINQSGGIYTSSQLYVNRMSNPNLKWERTTAINIGLDFGILDELLSGSIDFYNNTTNDLLVKRKLPEITGFTDVLSNLGQLENKGLEITLNSTPVRIDNFEWNTSVNFFMNRRKLKKLYGDMVDVLDENDNVIGRKEADDPTNGWFIGQDPDRIWEFERDGVWQLGEEKEAAVYGLAPGDLKYIDQNGDGVMTNADKVFQGYRSPRFNWSWRNEFRFYKNISLSSLIYSAWGHYAVFNWVSNTNAFPDRCTNYVFPRWTKDNPNNEWARIGSKNLGTNYLNRSFIRVDNITLSYSVPASFTKKIGVTDLRLSGSVRNPFMFAPDWKFWDPEKNTSDLKNADAQHSPISYTLGISFNL